MSDRSDRMLGYLSPWERGDPDVIAIMDAGAEELDGIEELMETVRTQAWPQKADDTYGLLGMHETVLQLPVAPAGVSLDDRQGAVRARMQGRRDGRKLAWVKRMDALAGTGNWDYQENTPGAHQITITLHLEETSGLAERVQTLATEFTPVVDEIIIAFSGGFLLGVSPLGDVAL